MCPAARIPPMRTAITSATMHTIKSGTRFRAIGIRSAPGSTSTCCARAPMPSRCTQSKRHERKKTMSANYTPNEMMTVAAARALTNDDVCFVGICAPTEACHLAPLTQEPDIVLISESGTIENKHNILQNSLGDGELCQTELVQV